MRSRRLLFKTVARSGHRFLLLKFTTRVSGSFSRTLGFELQISGFIEDLWQYFNGLPEKEGYEIYDRLMNPDLNSGSNFLNTNLI
jgi:hypothetical protein